MAYPVPICVLVQTAAWHLRRDGRKPDRWTWAWMSSPHRSVSTMTHSRSRRNRRSAGSGRCLFAFPGEWSSAHTAYFIHCEMNQFWPEPS